MIAHARRVVAAITLIFAALAGSQAMAEPNRVTFPDNFEDYVMYGDYTRGSGGELAYALPEVIEIAKLNQDLPYGTQLVLAIRRDNEVRSYFVMEKGLDWGLDYPKDRRTGDWQFQEFDLAFQVIPETNTAQRSGAAARGFGKRRLFGYAPGIDGAGP